MTYLDLLDAVNDAKTKNQREMAKLKLEGARQVLHWSGINDDLHTMDRFGDRPMCCGVLLDWEESK